MEGSGTGSFNSILSGLNNHLLYYIRAFASNNEGTVYGNEFQFLISNSYTQVDTILIPDGIMCNGICAYESSINITGFDPSATIQSADEIGYVRAKLEHTFIGDLYVSLTCPPDPVTGIRKSAIILKKYGINSSTECSGLIPSSGWGWNETSGVSSDADFGAALHNDGSDKCNPNTNPMGTPWNYCWSNNTTNGYQYANGQGYVYENVNQGHHLSNTVDSSDMANMTNIYHPDESFEALIGCPMNGTWSITIVDSWYGDNGYITEWEFAINGVTNVTPVSPEITIACPGVATVTDYDGNEYNTILIGNQCWMRENLRATHYASGDAISLSNETDPTTAHYYLPEVSDSTGIFGYLYNWKAVMGQNGSSTSNPSGVQGICPPGWHVPSEAEWIQLTNYMSSLEGYVCEDNPSNIAKALAADSLWNVSSNVCAVGNELSQNNTSDFSALPVGLAYGISIQYGTDANFWTSTSYNETYAYYHALNFNNGYVEQSSFGNKASGMSVRCILAEAPVVNTSEVINDILDTTATGGGEVISIGGAPVTERGLCWSTNTYPTIEDSHVICGSGLGVFTGQITSLTPSTTYYMRAYATNTAGTTYGTQTTFTTFNIPSIETYNITDITDTTATCGGDVTSDGGTAITARGICWNTTGDPTLAESHTNDGTGIGGFSSQLTGLIPGTTYYVRAYATNNIGTTYGIQNTFTTKDIPTVTLDSASNILSITASCTYHVIADGNTNLNNHGLCWSTTPYPTLNDSVTIEGSVLGNFTVQLSNLTPGTTYYLRAYATNEIGTAYSNQIAFITLTIPTVTTAEVSNISFFSAMSGGEVLATGVPEITARGICWSTSQNPTINDNHSTDSGGNGSFTSNMVELNLHTHYYVRAYAINSSGIAYGNQVSFTTLNTPSISTKTVTNITGSTANCGGNITSDGGGAILTKGICWSSSPNPTINDSIKIDTTSSYNFTCEMTGLSLGTTYYVKAFASNGGGLVYGAQRNFTTKDIPTITLDSATNVTSTSASCTYHISQTGGMQVTAKGICYSTSPNPTLEDSVVAGTANTGTLQLQELTPNTTYYVRAYATNGIGTSYSNQITFTTLTIPTLANTTILDVSFFTATIEGEVLATGVLPVTTRGFCWSTSQNPTIADNHTIDTIPADSTGFGIITSQITNLDLNTQYYVRAYATNSSGTGYSNQTTFTTLNTPTITTKTISNILDSTATCGGNITSTGGGTIISKGICWSTSPNPTISDSTAIDFSTQNNFSCSMTGLYPGTTYYVRAFATNGGGIAYGTQRNFTTKNIPTVAFDSVTDILSISVSCTGHISNDGGLSATARGFCYDTLPNPTLADNFTTNGTGIGNFSEQLDGLTPGTIYYVRAYATNAIGTAYSDQISFTTLTIPSVTTAEASNISFYTATCGGEVLATNIPEITARGICWSTSQNPTIADSHTSDSTEFGVFTSSITGLNPRTQYYVRAYAINSSGISYGNIVSFVTSSDDGQHCIGAATLTDVDSNIYNTLIIGNQCWMRENLRTTHYADGTNILLSYNTTSLTTAYQYYPNNNSDYLYTYGYLYNWKAVMGNDTSSTSDHGIQGICPDGWHIPSLAEWIQLKSYLNSQIQYSCNDDSTRNSKAIASTTGWNYSSTNCTPGNNPSDNNTSGFTGYPAGSFDKSELIANTGSPYGLGMYAKFWSSTQSNEENACTFTFYNGDAHVNISSNYSKRNGYSVRCLRD